MSHPTDETPEPTATRPWPAPPDDPEPGGHEPAGLEVEEQTPDGGRPAQAEAAATALPPSAVLPPATEEPEPPPIGAAIPPDTDLGEDAEPEPEADDEPEPLPPPRAKAPATAAATAPVLDLDDDEPPPKLVWYVLKVQSGREDTIRDALERRVKIQNLQRFFGRIVVPTEKITEIRNNKKRVVERKSYPGYLMVEMELNEKTWFLVRETPGVGDFVGGARGSQAEPWKLATPMTDTEVNQMLHQEEDKATAETPKVRIDVERGDRVKIKEGPFENFEGTVEAVIEERGLVKVMLIIFNRPTPVDLEYWQVERI